MDSKLILIFLINGFALIFSFAKTYTFFNDMKAGTDVAIFDTVWLTILVLSAFCIISLFFEKIIRIAFKKASIRGQKTRATSFLIALSVLILSLSFGGIIPLTSSVASIYKYQRCSDAVTISYKGGWGASLINYHLEYCKEKPA